jgi:hypothetical protein
MAYRQTGLAVFVCLALFGCGPAPDAGTAIGGVPKSK